jgi:recombination protein RecT
MNPIEKRSRIELTIKNNAEQLQMVLPQRYPIGKLIGTVLTAVVRNPKILICTQASIFGSIWAAATLGLDPNGLLGEGDLIPYKRKKKIPGHSENGVWVKDEWIEIYECQFLPGYRGFLKLAYNSPLVQTFTAYSVYENDKFSYSLGINQVLEHVPVTEADRGELTHVYAILRLKNGGVIFDVMTREEVDTVRLLSPNKEGNAWKQHFPEMAKKTVIRRMFKTTPISIEATRAAQLDEKVEVLNESQRNEIELINSTVFSEVANEIDENFIDEAELIEHEEVQEPNVSNGNGNSEKGKAAMNSALDMVKDKAKNGKNGNGKKAPDVNVTEEIVARIKNLREELGDAAEAGDRALADKLADDIKQARQDYKEITGREYMN